MTCSAGTKKLWLCLGDLSIGIYPSTPWRKGVEVNPDCSDVFPLVDSSLFELRWTTSFLAEISIKTQKYAVQIVHNVYSKKLENSSAYLYLHKLSKHGTDYWLSRSSV